MIQKDFNNKKVVSQGYMMWRKNKEKKFKKHQKGVFASDKHR